MENEVNETVVEQIDFDSYVGINFASSQKSYFFGVKGLELVEGDKVVVETIRGQELGIVTIAPISIDNYASKLALKPVVRKATDIDVRLYENNLKDAKFALDICKNEIKNLNLDMNLISCEYTLDKSKVIFAYVADERVDFRG